MKCIRVCVCVSEVCVCVCWFIKLRMALLLQVSSWHLSERCPLICNFNLLNFTGSMATAHTLTYSLAGTSSLVARQPVKYVEVQRDPEIQVSLLV